MAERKQKLIHLHSAEALSVAKANAVNMAVGEIAVQAADQKDSSLWILTSDGKQVVQFPSVTKVESLITGKTSTDITTLKADVKELKATVDGYSSTGTTVKAAIEAVNSSLQGQIDTIDGLIGDGFSSGSTITSQLAAVKSTADGANKQATTNATAISTINSALGSLTGANAVPNEIAKSKTKVVAATGSATTDFLTVSDNSATNPASGVTYTLTLKNVASAKGLSDLKATVDGNKSNIDTLLGLHASGDTNGYATVAKEVADGIAKVVANAPANFDTLKEIADWIQNDTTGAASMTNDIKKLKDALTGYSTSGAVQNAFTTVNGNITTINNVLKGLEGESAATKAIAAAKTTITEANTGLILISSSADTDGHINYTITPNGIASNSALTALTQTVNTLQTDLSDEVTNRTNADKSINDKIGDGFDSTNTVAKAVAAAKTKVAADTGTSTTNFLELSNDSETNPANGVTYTIKLKDVASANDLSTLKSAAAKSGKITVDSQEFKATSVDATNSLNFDLSNLVIDCGTY